MPSGPKKRARARRQKQEGRQTQEGSPSHTDANSDRDTEALSVAGSADVDDHESGLDTPKVSSSSSAPRRTFAALDREAVSSQTDEWVRVSDFDLGTPTSQAEPSSSSSAAAAEGRERAEDRLGDWETVSGYNSNNGGAAAEVISLEEEEEEAASGHSSESFTHLHPPHAARGREDGDDRVSSSSSSSSSGNRSSRLFSEDKSLLETRGGEEDEAVEKVVLHVVAPVSGINFPSAAADPDAEEKECTSSSSLKIAPAVETDDAPDVVLAPENAPKDGKLFSAAVEEESGEAQNEIQEQSYANVVKEPGAEETEKSDRPNSDGGQPEKSYAAVVVESAEEDEEFAAQGEEPKSYAAAVADSSLDDELSGRGWSGPEEEEEAKDVSVDEKAAEEKRVASTSGDAERTEADGKAEEEKEEKKEKSSAEAVPDFEEAAVATGAEKQLDDALPAAGSDEKAISGSGTSDAQRRVLADDGKLSTTAASGASNGIVKPHLEAKEFSGCCDVLYWLLGREY